jgi:hypothetical protein
MKRNIHFLLFFALLILITSCREGKEFRDEQNDNLPGTWEVELYYKEVRDNFGNILAVEPSTGMMIIPSLFMKTAPGRRLSSFSDSNGLLVSTFLWRARTSKSMVISFGVSISSPDRIIFQDPIIWNPPKLGKPGVQRWCRNISGGI